MDVASLVALGQAVAQYVGQGRHDGPQVLVVHLAAVQVVLPLVFVHVNEVEVAPDASHFQLLELSGQQAVVVLLDDSQSAQLVVSPGQGVHGVQVLAEFLDQGLLLPDILLS